MRLVVWMNRGPAKQFSQPNSETKAGDSCPEGHCPKGTRAIVQIAHKSCNDPQRESKNRRGNYLDKGAVAFVLSFKGPSATLPRSWRIASLAGVFDCAHFHTMPSPIGQEEA